MGKNIRLKVYAKVNLYLAVLGKRRDGYHDLVSLMHNVSIYDVLEIEEGAEYFQCDVDLLWNESNTLYRALKIFEEKSGVHPKVGIKLFKKIPMKGGLGGASADAATLLKYLKDSYRCSCDLLELAEVVGSDVPFFINGGCAMVEGRGEKITQLRALNFPVDFYFPEVGFSTREMYSLLDDLNLNGANGSAWKLYEGLKSRNLSLVRQNVYNSFLEVVKRTYPKVIEEAKVRLNSCDIVSMSGSGSTFYGLKFDKTKEGFRLIDRPRDIIV